MERPDFFSLKNGSKSKLPFSNKEYEKRLSIIRIVMSKNNLDMIILTSMHNIAYHTGFIYCSFGRPYGCVITENKIVTIIFDGFIPDLFQEEMGVILDGYFQNEIFYSDDMLVKHDNEYISEDGQTYNVENYSE